MDLGHWHWMCFESWKVCFRCHDRSWAEHDYLLQMETWPLMLDGCIQGQSPGDRQECQPWNHGEERQGCFKGGFSRSNYVTPVSTSRRRRVWCIRIFSKCSLFHFSSCRAYISYGWRESPGRVCLKAIILTAIWHSTLPLLILMRRKWHLNVNPLSYGRID